jgi:uncharacterized protein YggT (Ycf19 family)
MSKSRLAPRTNQNGYGAIASLIGLIFGIILVTLILRFAFRLLGANPDAGFVSFIYSFTAPLVSPFFGIFNTNGVDLATGRVEFETLIAILVYGLIASVLERVAGIGGHHRAV